LKDKNGSTYVRLPTFLKNWNMRIQGRNQLIFPGGMINLKLHYFRANAIAQLLPPPGCACANSSQWFSTISSKTNFHNIKKN